MDSWIHVISSIHWPCCRHCVFTIFTGGGGLLSGLPLYILSLEPALIAYCLLIHFNPWWLFVQGCSSSQHCSTELVFTSPVLLCVCVCVTNLGSYIPPLICNQKAILAHSAATHSNFGKLSSVSWGPTFPATLWLFLNCCKWRINRRRHISRSLELHVSSLLTFTWTVAEHFISAYLSFSLAGIWRSNVFLCKHQGVPDRVVFMCVYTFKVWVLLLHPQGLMPELLGRGAAVFTTCYETSLLCNCDSVTLSEMKVMPLHINASCF